MLNLVDRSTFRFRINLRISSFNKENIWVKHAWKGEGGGGVALNTQKRLGMRAKSRRTQLQLFSSLLAGLLAGWLAYCKVNIASKPAIDAGAL